MRRYSAGSWIPVIVDITTNHGGFFIFKLCHNDDVTRDPGQECFESNILQVASYSLSPSKMLLSDTGFPDHFQYKFL